METGGSTPSNRSPAPSSCGGSSAATIGIAGMDLGADVAGDQPDDPLDLGGLEPHAGIDPAFAQPVEPQRAVGIDHDLDDVRDRPAPPRSPAPSRCAAWRGAGLAPRGSTSRSWRLRLRRPRTPRRAPAAGELPADLVDEGLETGRGRRRAPA